MARKEATGSIRFNPAVPVDKWSFVKGKLWQTFNPWAGTFSRGGVYGLMKNVTVQSTRESLAQEIGPQPIPLRGFEQVRLRGPDIGSVGLDVLDQSSDALGRFII